MGATTAALAAALVLDKLEPTADRDGSVDCERPWLNRSHLLNAHHVARVVDGIGSERGSGGDFVILTRVVPHLHPLGCDTKPTHDAPCPPGQPKTDRKP